MANAIWTREQIAQVEGLRAKLEVSVEALDRGARPHAKERMTRALVRMAAAFAVDAHEADFRFREASEPNDRWAVEMECWWEPRTREVEFHGGPSDGTLLEVREAPREPVIVATSAPLDLARYVEPDPVELDMGKVVYSLSGWRETERRWIYSTA